MIEFTTVDTFEIKGRGIVHTGNLPLGMIPSDIPAGSKVKLDGDVVTVRGVEAWGKIWTEHDRETGPHPVGLLV